MTHAQLQFRGKCAPSAAGESKPADRLTVLRQWLQRAMHGVPRYGRYCVAGALVAASSGVVQAQWFGPGNSAVPPSHVPPRMPAPVAGAVPYPPGGNRMATLPRPSSQVPSSPGAGVSVPLGSTQAPGNPSYPATTIPTLPVSASPTATPALSTVDQLLANAAEQERVGNSWQAIQSYRQALQIDPRNQRALLSYARMKHRARDFEGAIMLYQQMLQYNPQDAVAMNDLGLCYARMGDTPQAVTALQQAIGRQPDSKRYRNNLAVVLVEAGKSDEALQTLVPVHGPAVANYNVAWLLARLGKNEEAIRYLNATLLADPSFPAAVTLLTQLEASSPALATLPPISTTPVVSNGNEASIYPSTSLPESQPPIQLRSGTLSDDDLGKATAAVYDAPLAEEPPSLDDYKIPGLEFDE